MIELMIRVRFMAYFIGLESSEVTDKTKNLFFLKILMFHAGILSYDFSFEEDKV